MTTRAKDHALTTARDFLDGTICECGHTKDDHILRTRRPWPCFVNDGDDNCECRDFRAVPFTVERQRPTAHRRGSLALDPPVQRHAKRSTRGKTSSSSPHQ